MVTRVSLRDELRSSVICEELEEEWLVPCIKRSHGYETAYNLSHC